ncbi:MAG TPA: CaiB/BaiF CoA-transferase family protein [Vicinamibacterales bacterium]|nr:CaiB/BaiF CoA-transferase family protein [Vicinamibacterales bacterium]
MPPLDGVRVLDLTRLLPGAYATKLLADRGADVVKIEDPRGGDTMRTLGARYFDALNHGKKSVTLDLRSADASAVLDALLARADVVVDSFRPSTAARLGVDAATLRRRHPRLICASMIGFPRDSTSAERPAHDINYEALAGLLRPPVAPGPLVADIGAAMQTAIAVLAAIVERQRTGVGAAIDVPLSEAAREWTLFPSTRDFESACYALYETADGEWLALGALEAKFWQTFCAALERPEFLPLQHARRFDEIRAVMRTKTRDEWLARFEGVDTCLTPVVGPPDSPARAKAPSLGADTDAVLEAAGLDAASRARLRDRRVI